MQNSPETFSSVCWALGHKPGQRQEDVLSASGGHTATNPDSASPAPLCNADRSSLSPFSFFFLPFEPFFFQPKSLPSFSSFISHCASCPFSPFPVATHPFASVWLGQRTSPLPSGTFVSGHADGSPVSRPGYPGSGCHNGTCSS